MFNYNWSKAPEISFEKVLCPVCNEPTGPNSNCHEKRKQEKQETDGYNENINEFIDDKQQNYFLVNGRPLTIPFYHQQCQFRQNNEFLIHTNYPFSNPLCASLRFVEGIENLHVFSPYRARVIIAKKFSDKEVLTNISNTYRDFIKDIVAQITKLENLLDKQDVQSNIIK